MGDKRADSEKARLTECTLDLLDVGENAQFPYILPNIRTISHKSKNTLVHLAFSLSGTNIFYKGCFVSVSDLVHKAALNLGSKNAPCLSPNVFKRPALIPQNSLVQIPNQQKKFSYIICQR